MYPVSHIMLSSIHYLNHSGMELCLELSFYSEICKPMTGECCNTNLTRWWISPDSYRKLDDLTQEAASGPLLVASRSIFHSE